MSKTCVNTDCNFPPHGDEHPCGRVLGSLGGKCSYCGRFEQRS